MQQNDHHKAGGTVSALSFWQTHALSLRWYFNTEPLKKAYLSKQLCTLLSHGLRMSSSVEQIYYTKVSTAEQLDRKSCTLRCVDKARLRSHKVWPIKTLVVAAFLQQLLGKVSFACILKTEYAGLVTCRAPTLNTHKDASGVPVEFLDFLTVLVCTTAGNKPWQPLSQSKSSSQP